MIEEILTKLGLSGGAVRVYSKLLMLKEASAKRISDASGIARTSVYDYLVELEKFGLVLELDVDNKKLFKLDDPKNILSLLDKRLLDLEKEKLVLRKLLPDLQSGFGKGEPRVKFYPGEDGFIAVLGDVARSGAEEALFLWPFGEMTGRIGEETLQDFTRRRVRGNMSVRSVWPHSAPTGASRGTPSIKLINEKIRLAPAKTTWRMGSIIYGDKVAYVSSKLENFAFIVQSHDFASLQKMQFENLWKLSKPMR